MGYYINKKTGEKISTTEYNKRYLTPPKAVKDPNDPTATEESAINQLKIAKNVVKELKDAYTGMVGKEYEGTGAGVLSRFKGIKRSIGAAVGTNEDARIYKNLAESNLSIIARALKAEKGVLTEQDVSRARGALAKLGSSPKEAKALFDAIDRQAESNLKILYGKDAEDVKVPRQDKIAQLRMDAQKAEDSANRSLTSRTLQALPGQAARTLLETPARFLASAAAAPIDIGRSLAGQEPLQGNIPLVNKPTYQAQASQEIGGLYDKAYAGEKFGVGDYAKALKPFVEVPMAGLETVVLGKGIQKAGSGVKRLFEGRRTARDIQNAVDMVAPALDKKDKIAAFAQAGKPGGVVRGRFGTVKSTPSRQDIEVAKAAAPFVKGKDPVKTVENLGTEVARFSDESVRPYLQANPRAYNRATLAKALDGVDPPDWIKADATAERTYNMVKARMIGAATNHPGTMEGLWESRKAFDQEVKRQFGDAILDPNKRTYVNRAIRDVRAGVNDFIATQTGDSQFGESMKYLNRLYIAIDNIADKYYKTVDAPSYVAKFGKYVVGAAAGTAVSAGVGAGLYGALSTRQ